MSDDRISIEAVRECQTMLADFADNVDRGIRLVDFLNTLKPTILTLHNKGVSLAYICDLFNMKGVRVTPRLLQNSLSLAPDDPPKKGRPKKMDPIAAREKNISEEKKPAQEALRHTPRPDSGDDL